MKLAKDIKEAIYEQVDYDLVASCFTGWEEVESIVAEKLEPMREAFVNIVKHQDVVMSNMPRGMSATRRIAAKALALFEE